MQRGRRSRKGLSERQGTILSFLRDFDREHGYPPSIREIVGACNISSTSVADYNLRALEEAGYIRRDRDISRGIELLDRDRDANDARVISIPVKGKIAAGEPIPVPSADTWQDTDSDETLDLTEELTQGRPGVYALRVKGLSMIEDLINDGDLVLLEHTETARNGETVAVWLNDREEVTLKRFYNEGKRIRLQPANATMEPIYVDPANVRIQGRVIGVIRQY